MRHESQETCSIKTTKKVSWRRCERVQFWLTVSVPLASSFLPFPLGTKDIKGCSSTNASTRNKHGNCRTTSLSMQLIEIQDCCSLSLLFSLSVTRWWHKFLAKTTKSHHATMTRQNIAKLLSPLLKMFQISLLSRETRRYQELMDALKLSRAKMKRVRVTCVAYRVAALFDTSRKKTWEILKALVLCICKVWDHDPAVDQTVVCLQEWHFEKILWAGFPCFLGTATKRIKVLQEPWRLCWEEAKATSRSNRSKLRSSFGMAKYGNWTNRTNWKPGYEYESGGHDTPIVLWVHLLFHYRNCSSGLRDNLSVLSSLAPWSVKFFHDWRATMETTNDTTWVYRKKECPKFNDCLGVKLSNLIP